MGELDDLRARYADDPVALAALERAIAAGQADAEAGRKLPRSRRPARRANTTAMLGGTGEGSPALKNAGGSTGATTPGFDEARSQ